MCVSPPRDAFILLPSSASILGFCMESSAGVISELALPKRPLRQLDQYAESVTQAAARGISEGRLLVGLGKSCVILAAMSLSACATSGSVISSGERYAINDQLSETYLLGAGDQVRVVVFNEPTLSGDFFISGDGELALPLIGSVPAGNKTTKDVAADYARLLADGYLRDPRVSMEVITYRPFFILGEVDKPGQYPYATGMTVLNAVATANGFSPRAKKSRVYIRRRGEEGELEYELTPNLRVLPGDTIRIGERYF
jgi:polysaccharide biosynthesis/export protein